MATDIRIDCSHILRLLSGFNVRTVHSTGNTIYEVSVDGNIVESNQTNNDDRYYLKTQTYTKTEINDLLNNIHPTVSFTDITNKPTTLLGYGITDVFTQSQTNTNFIKNQLVSAQTANFWITGTGRLNTAPVLATDLVRLQDLTMTDSIISGLTLSLSSPNIVVASGSWRLGNIIYSKSTSTSLLLSTQDVTLSRYDSVYATNINTIAIVHGTLSSTPSVPAIPGGTLRVGDILITPSSIDLIPSIPNDYVDKTTSQTITGAKTFNPATPNVFKTTNLYTAAVTIDAANTSRGMEFINQTANSYTDTGSLADTWFQYYDTSLSGLTFSKSGQPAISFKNAGIIQRSSDSAVVLWSTDASNGITGTGGSIKLSGSLTQNTLIGDNIGSSPYNFNIGVNDFFNNTHYGFLMAPNGSIEYSLFATNSSGNLGKTAIDGSSISISVTDTDGFVSPVTIGGGVGAGLGTFTLSGYTISPGFKNTGISYDPVFGFIKIMDDNNLVGLAYNARYLTNGMSNLRWIPDLEGSMTKPYKAVTSTYSILDLDHTLNCTSGTFTITLPTAVGITGRVYIIKVSAGTITLATTSSQTIDGSAPGVITGINRYQSTGANWILI